MTIKSLSDLLPEPKDGTVLVTERGTARYVIERIDVASRPRWPRARWFYADSVNPDRHGWTWEEITQGAQRVRSLGPLLADLEAER